ncbi:AbrB/MazE/SpoVT family DNA-binding domain-containing protein [Methylomagnum sp.]
MTTAVMNNQGQVTIPPAIRRKLGLDQGGPVEFVELDGGMIGIVTATEDVSSLKGIIKKPARPVSLEDMARAIRQRGAGL